MHISYLNVRKYVLTYLHIDKTVSSSGLVSELEYEEECQSNQVKRLIVGNTVSYMFRIALIAFLFSFFFFHGNDCSTLKKPGNAIRGIQTEFALLRVNVSNARPLPSAMISAMKLIRFTNAFVN